MKGTTLSNVKKKSKDEKEQTECEFCTCFIWTSFKTRRLWRFASQTQVEIRQAVQTPGLCGMWLTLPNMAAVNYKTEVMHLSTTPQLTAVVAEHYQLTTIVMSCCSFITSEVAPPGAFFIGCYYSTTNGKYKKQVLVSYYETGPDGGAVVYDPGLRE